MAAFPVSACTDITGFGLLGHLHEMTSASGVDAEIVARSVPLLPGVTEMASAGAVPGGTRNNLDYVSPHITWPAGFPEFRKHILCDAQTSGGLLIAVPETLAPQMIRDGLQAGVNMQQIGIIAGAGSGKIEVK
jgi:selenide,water dikinase